MANTDHQNTERRRSGAVGSEARIGRSKRAVMAEALLLVLTAPIVLAAADAAFVHKDNISSRRSHRRQSCSSISISPAFVSPSRIKGLPAAPSFGTASITPAYQTRLFSGDDDDDGDTDMDADYDDDDYDDSDLVIDVEGDGDYDDFDDDDDDVLLEDDPYLGLAASEFGSDYESSSSSALATTNDPLATDLNWGGALGSLRARMEDIEAGTSGDPSQALFRLMSAASPNQMIGNFVSSANPQVVQAMSGAVSSLLGGLANPNMGVDIQVKATGEKISSLCFQLQMTGYMFRNAEYVLALKDLMNLRGKKLTIRDYKEAFDRVDADGSGYIELSEIQDLFIEAYGGHQEDIPPYEIKAFLEFFDTNEDGRVSWEEFEQGLTSANTPDEQLSAKDDLADRLLASMESAGGAMDDDEEEETSESNEEISGTLEIELESGKVVEVDAQEYMESLMEEARKLKLALRQEKGAPASSQGGGGETDPMAGILSGPQQDGTDIAGYIASRQGDVKSLTEGIKPEIVDTMKKLVSFVLDGGDSGLGRRNLSPEEKASMEMEIPGSALQQLALWQLVLGYRLREEEAKGDYVNLLK
mmetsp:Transcript_19108/g.44376  ORF Transcript_19108/g.44376 Transcript_19108/m.44376 type:complete len:587 (+) Transcript_19108:154-1914(+)